MENRLALRNGGPVVLAALAAIVLLGLGLRVENAWEGRAPVYDAQAYAAIAANLERGEGFTAGPHATQPASNYSPGLPLFVAGIYEAAGGVHERLARLILAVIGTLAVLFTYLLARRLLALLPSPAFGQGKVAAALPALGAAVAVAVYPALLEYQGMLMGEPLAATLLSGAVLAALWARDGEREGAKLRTSTRWLLPGLLFGALSLVRPEYLGITVLAALAVALGPSCRFLSDSDEKRQLGRRVRAAGGVGAAVVLLAGAALAVAPWTVRNAVALDRFVPISTGGGQVLFAGTYLPSDGNPEKVGAEVVGRNPDLFAPGAAGRLRLEQILARLAARERPGEEADRALSRMGKEQLWTDIRDEPLETAGFVASKIARIWSHGPRDVMREPGWEALHWLLVAAGLLGLGLLAWRRRWEALLIGTIFLAITAISAILVASPRRVLVLLPLLAALAAVGLLWLGARIARLASSQGHGRQKAPTAPPGGVGSLGPP
ncbi:MAG TPA: hypothetical protein VFN82_03775 [Solirubrobacterales bacterium]|nr:hypothetical protein [Solirubrobacterales bacterium]